MPEQIADWAWFECIAQVAHGREVGLVNERGEVEGFGRRQLGADQARTIRVQEVKTPGRAGQATDGTFTWAERVEEEVVEPERGAEIDFPSYGETPCNNRH